MPCLMQRAWLAPCVSSGCSIRVSVLLFCPSWNGKPWSKSRMDGRKCRKGKRGEGSRKPLSCPAPEQGWWGPASSPRGPARLPGTLTQPADLLCHCGCLSLTPAASPAHLLLSPRLTSSWGLPQPRLAERLLSTHHTPPQTRATSCTVLYISPPRSCC